MIIENLSWLSSKGEKKAYENGALYAGLKENCPAKYKHLITTDVERLTKSEKRYIIIRIS